jgi:4-amino-4-deoxychorismate mutase
VSAGLDPFRRRLDEVDEQIARLFGERFAICREVADFKSAHDIPMMQPGRVAEVRARYLARGADVDLPEDFTSSLFELVIGATCNMEDELMGTPESERVSAPGRIASAGDGNAGARRRLGSARRLGTPSGARAGKA